MSFRRWQLPALAVALLLAFPAAADLELFGLLPGGPSLQPPNAAGTALEAFEAPFVGWSFWVEERGTYSIASEFVSADFPGRVVLYRGPVLLERPLDDLIRVADFEGGAAAFDVTLEAGVIYYVLVTVAEDGFVGGPTLDFEVAVAGPSEPMLSSCLPPGDDPVANDLGESLALQSDLVFPFCTFVTARTAQEDAIQGTTAPFRSEDSGVFWFFNPDNWEVLVKVLDGCAVNGHYWVFFAATTNVEFELEVTPKNLGLGFGRIYRNEAGETAETVTDTAAFPCP